MAETNQAKEKKPAKPAKAAKKAVPKKAAAGKVPAKQAAKGETLQAPGAVSAGAEAGKPAMQNQAKQKQKKGIVGIVSSNLAFVGLLLLLGIVVIAAWPVIFSGPETVGLDDFHTGDGGSGSQPGETTEILKFFAIYTTECPECEIDSSFVKLLFKNNVAYDAEKIKEDSELGQRFIEELGLVKLPVMIVDGESITSDMVIASSGTLQFGGTPDSTIGLKTLLLSLVEKYPDLAKHNSNRDIFVLYEMGLDGARHIDYLLGEACPPENPHDKARVDLFVDPYGTPYLSALDTIHFYRHYYENGMEFNFRHYPIEASTLFKEGTPQGTIETIAEHFVCAEEHGIISDAENAFYAAYCSLDNDNTLSAIEKKECDTSEHFGTPIGGSEADEISKEQLGLTESDIAECLETTEENFAEARHLAEELYITRVPTAVINCKYATHAINIDRALCKLNPELDHCEQYG